MQAHPALAGSSGLSAFSQSAWTATKEVVVQPAQDIVARAQEGDALAIDSLIRTHSPGIYRFVHRLVRDAEDAEDLTQEVFLRMIRHIGRFDPSYRFETWLYRIARNLCYDRGRKKQRWRFARWSREEADEGRDPISQLAETDPDALTATLAKETGETLDAAVAALRPPYREILVLFHYEDLSYQEIAQILEVPMGTVMNRLYRARQALKKALLNGKEA